MGCGASSSAQPVTSGVSEEKVTQAAAANGEHAIVTTQVNGDGKKKAQDDASDDLMPVSPNGDSVTPLAGLDGTGIGDETKSGYQAARDTSNIIQKRGSVNATLNGLNKSLVATSSHSSKLDGSLIRTPESEKQDILNRILVCRNCEEVDLPLAVWCEGCHKIGDESPPVFCETCNTDLHQFAKTKNHVRDALDSIHTLPMKSAAELGLSTAVLPTGLPALECLACSICDSTSVSMYCAQCKTILCTDCAKDIHTPKSLRDHTRTPIHCKFITSGFHAATKSHVIAPSKQGSISSKPPATALPPKRDSFTKNFAAVPPKPAGTMSNALALISKHRTGAAPIKAATPTSTLHSPALSTSSVKTFMPSSSPPPTLLTKVRNRKKSTEDNSDIVPTENPGLGGDVFIFADPGFTDGLNEIQLGFRNTLNPFDSIGSVQIVSISCGMDHAGAVTALGTLFMWGSNAESQLGCGAQLGAERHSAEPLLIEFERHLPIRQVACGSVHTLALGQDGSVWSFGDGKMGKLGHGMSDDDKEVPTQVLLGHWGPRGNDETEDMSGNEEVIFIACGQNNSGCIVRGRTDKNQLYIWGEGASGQIPATPGDTNTLTPRLYPQLVLISTPENQSDPTPDVSLLSFGTKHVVIATKVGTVFSWGDNSYGQCGYTLAQNDGDNIALQLVPRLVPKLYLDGVKAKTICCGERHTTILSAKGDVWSFGSGESHQIGILDNVDQFLPQRAIGLGPAANNPIQSISVGASISAAINEGGETFLWGYGVESPCPKLVAGLKAKAGQKIAVGSNSNLAFLTGSTAELYEWQFDGASLDAEETHGTSAGEGDEAAAAAAAADAEPKAGGKGVPQVNVNLRGKRIIAMSSGKNHYCVITADGKAFVWGSNYLHECGLKLPGDISFIPHPMELKIKVPLVEVRCSVEHSIALAASGAVYTWGAGFEGRLGHVSNSDVDEPKLVASLFEANILAKCIAIGPSNTAIVSTEGQLFVWGAGNGGQIGNEDMMPAFKPTLVKALLHEKVKEVAIGNYHVMALTESGLVYTQGDNKFGQLGLYPTYQEENAPYPQPVEALNMLKLNPTHIECGDNVCMVLTASGEIYGWGTGETMQLCRRDAPAPGVEAEEDPSQSEDVPSPVKLKFPFQKAGEILKITSFSIRDINCCCITEDQSVWVWGWEFGEYPNKLIVKKPLVGSAAALHSTSSVIAAFTRAPIKQMEVVKFEKITLGHSRMLLMT